MADPNLCVSDTFYRTPLPQTPLEKDLWRHVIRLYELRTLADVQARAKECAQAAADAATTPPTERHNDHNEARCTDVHYDNEAAAAREGEEEEGPPPPPPPPPEPPCSTSIENDIIMCLGELTAQLRAMEESGTVVSASVLDVAIQHPLPGLRRVAVRVMLHYPCWRFDCCAPVAVAAAVGDEMVVHMLLLDRRLAPNSGFPLVRAVRQKNMGVLKALLAHHRVRPNYGGALYEAVRRGDLAAVRVLGEHKDIKMNSRANGRCETVLTYMTREFAFLVRGLHHRGSPYTIATAREMLEYLLQHPRTDVNIGFYATPLQIAVRLRCAVLVQLLLQYASVHVNVPAHAAATLAESFFLLRQRSIPVAALHNSVRAPLDLALHLRDVATFAVLVRDIRVRAPKAMLKTLEQDPRAMASIPFQEAFAVYRQEWEGPAWYRRRLCVLVGAASGVVLTVSNVLLAFVCLRKLDRTLFVALCVTYVLTTPVSACMYYLRRAVYLVPPCSEEEEAAPKENDFTALAHLLLPTGRPATHRALGLVLALLPSCLPVAEVLLLRWNAMVHQNRTVLSDRDAEAQWLHFIGTPSTFSTPRSLGSSATPRRRSAASASFRRLPNDDSPRTPYEVIGLGNESFSRPDPALGAARALRRLNEDATEALPPLHRDSPVTSPATFLHRQDRKKGGKAVDVTVVRIEEATTPVSPTLAGASATAEANAAYENEGPILLRTSSLQDAGATVRLRSSSTGDDLQMVHKDEYSFAAPQEYSRPDLFARAVLYLCFESLSPSRLLVCVVNVFVLLLALFPSTSTPATSGTTTGSGASTSASYKFRLSVPVAFVCFVSFCATVTSGCALLTVLFVLNGHVKARQQRQQQEEEENMYVMEGDEQEEHTLDNYMV